MLERDHQISRLHELLESAGSGSGQLLFLSAEAGGGKSTLIEHFADSVRDRAAVRVVSCDGLGMPGPFGPLYDIASALGPKVEAVLNANAPRDLTFRTVLSALQDAPEANVFVGEDAHWSDEASLDLIRFLGRRIGATRTLLIVTYRDDHLDSYHPLRRVLGDLVNQPSVSRMSLPPLSLDAVTTLSTGSTIDPAELHRQTGGNPFYVSEIVASGDSTVPVSIRDAILGRASRISIDARAALDAAAAIGPAPDLELLSAVTGAPIEVAVDECLAIGMFRPWNDGIDFRHALTREVILTSMSASRRRGLHRRILNILETDPAFAAAADLPRLAHHAEESRDRDAVLRYAPEAARHAARCGAHREAAAQYARTLRFAGSLPDTALAEFLEARSYECYLTGQPDVAITEITRAAELRNSSGDSLRYGDDLRLLSRYHWFSGQNAEARSYARASMDVLESLPPGPEMAMACSNLSQLHMLAYEREEARRWGQRAIDLATELGNPPILAHALTNVGTEQSRVDFAAGRQLIERGLEIARAFELHDDVSRALTNLAFSALEQHELDVAETYINEGIAFTAENDLIAMELYLRALRSQHRLARGELGDAISEASEISRHPSATAASRIVSCTVLGLAQARRGDISSDPFNEALGIAEQTGELMRLGPLRCARAEAAWLAGDPELSASEAGSAYSAAVRTGSRWLAGELALWLHRAGRDIGDTSSLAEPFAHEINGDSLAAATCWRELGYPLEEARAVASAGDEMSLRNALVIFDRMGAKPDIARTVRLMRLAGAKQIPRGLRPKTRANKAHLTGRELEVLQRLALGESNREIASALFLSPRTVGHHVSAILAKLEISTRSEATARAEALGILSYRSTTAPK
jgi:DNA-binding CsgD family transcriptional regulator/tetratricopeptide (TPR) repeat protein